MYSCSSATSVVQCLGSGLQQPCGPLSCASPSRKNIAIHNVVALQLPAPDTACLCFSAVYTDVDVMFWSTFDPCTVDRPAVMALVPEVNHRGDPFNTYNSGVMLMNISVRPVRSLAARHRMGHFWSAATLAASVRGHSCCDRKSAFVSGQRTQAASCRARDNLREPLVLPCAEVLGQSDRAQEGGLLRQHAAQWCQLQSRGHTEAPSDAVLLPLRAHGPLWRFCFMRLACQDLHLALITAACMACPQGACLSPDSRKVIQ